MGTFGHRFFATGGSWQVASRQELDVQFGNVCKLFLKIKIKIMFIVRNQIEKISGLTEVGWVVNTAP